MRDKTKKEDIMIKYKRFKTQVKDLYENTINTLTLSEGFDIADMINLQMVDFIFSDIFRTLDGLQQTEIDLLEDPLNSKYDTKELPEWMLDDSYFGDLGEDLSDILGDITTTNNGANHKVSTMFGDIDLEEPHDIDKITDLARLVSGAILEENTIANSKYHRSEDKKCYEKALYIITDIQENNSDLDNTNYKNNIKVLMDLTTEMVV